MYALGDVANIPYGDGEALPQLGSVAQQSGDWAAGNIIADLEGSGRQPFHYQDKGIMAMIGRKAAVAEIGAHRHELHGRFAFAAWLGVHAQLLANAGAEVKAFLAWAEDFYLRPAPPLRRAARPVATPTRRASTGTVLTEAVPRCHRDPKDTDASPADVLVIFGITGDLAKVMTFRSLYRLEARGLLDCPIVGRGRRRLEPRRAASSTRARRSRRPARRSTTDGLRPPRRADDLPGRRLRRRRDLPQGRRRDQGRRGAGVLPGDPAVPVRPRSPRAWPRPA